MQGLRFAVLFVVAAFVIAIVAAWGFAAFYDAQHFNERERIRALHTKEITIKQICENECCN